MFDQFFLLFRKPQEIYLSPLLLFPFVLFCFFFFSFIRPYNPNTSSKFIQSDATPSSFSTTTTTSTTATPPPNQKKWFAPPRNWLEGVLNYSPIKVIYDPGPNHITRLLFIFRGGKINPERSAARSHRFALLIYPTPAFCTEDECRSMVLRARRGN